MKLFLAGLAAIAFLFGAYKKKKKLDEFQPEVKKFNDLMTKIRESQKKK